MKPEFYQDKQGGWRWRLVARNGLIVADSAESYTRQADVKRAYRAVVAGISAARNPQ